MKQDDYTVFESFFDAGAEILKIVSSLKLDYHDQV